MASETPASPRATGDGSPRAEPRPGNERRVVRIGKYDVLQHLATGGMGAVYRARDTETNQEVALKVLIHELAARPTMLERFRREARSACRLEHENIVKVHEFSEVAGTYFLVMEYVEGIDLHDCVKRQGSLDPEEARQIVLQAARALEHADQQNIVHRDIKPSNILLSRRDGKPCVKLIDFGLARAVDSDDFRVTRAGTTVGTVDYMSPEQARDSSAADIRSDLYSLGCTWYHLLAGRSPFPDGPVSERLVRVIHDLPPDVRDLNPNVSDACWEVMLGLLAKDRKERFQTPRELIDALGALEGNTTLQGRRPSRKALVAKRPATAGSSGATLGPRLPSREETETADRARKGWVLVSAIAVVLLILGALVAFNMPQPPPDEGNEGNGPPSLEEAPRIAPPAVPTPTPVPPPAPHVAPGPATIHWPSKAVSPARQMAADPGALRLLSPAVRTVDVKAIRAEVEAPWSNAPPLPSDATVVRVRRAGQVSPASFRSLADACKAGAPGKPLVLEIHDNGPLFEVPLAFADRDVVIRAGAGFRPLIVWDLRESEAHRKKNSAPGQTFLQLQRGRLFLEGIELAVNWPENATHPATMLEVEEGELSLRNCTLSATGKARTGVVLTRLSSSREGVRCRFSRCHLRGAGLLALDLHVPGAEVLFDGCLVAGGQQPLLRIDPTGKAPRLRLVRSTFVGHSTLLELRPRKLDTSPGLHFLGWDSLFSRCGHGEGTLLDLPAHANARGVQWRAINCFYAGWTRLLSGAHPIGPDRDVWQRHWAGVELDGVSAAPWPEVAYTEPATHGAGSYQPSGAVLLGATVDVRQPLGCDLTALPPSRDAWQSQILEPSLAPVDMPLDASLVDIPTAADAGYQGERLDLTDVDLGDYLKRVQASGKLAPRVVLHLTGKGERPTSPIRIKGSSLILCFEEPPDKETPRLALMLSSSRQQVPLVEVEGGSLEILGGILRLPEQDSSKASHVVRVKGGDVRLSHTRLEGPQHAVPEGYTAALTLVGSGDPALDRSHSCAINESVILSSSTGIALEGIGCRLALRQSLVVAGRDALLLAPTGCRGRAAMQASLVQSTFAARRAVVRLTDAPGAGVPTEPVFVQARECAYLNPFPGRPSRAGLLVWEGEALPRGLLLWQGEREGFDRRLHFAATEIRSIRDVKEGCTPWKQLWGGQGVRSPRDLLPWGTFDPRRWHLERLVLRMRDPPGATLDRLGITARKPVGSR